MGPTEDAVIEDTDDDNSDHESDAGDEDRRRGQGDRVSTSSAFILFNDYISRDLTTLRNCRF